MSSEQEVNDRLEEVRKKIYDIIVSSDVSDHPAASGGVVVDFILSAELMGVDGNTYFTYLRDFSNGTWRTLGLLDWTQGILHDSRFLNYGDEDSDED